MEKSVFLKVCYMIPKLTTAVEVVACFEALCGVRSLNELSKKVQTLKLTKEEIKLIDKECDWSIAKHWAQWWARCEHLKMLSKVFTSMSGGNVLPQPMLLKEKTRTASATVQGT